MRQKNNHNKETLELLSNISLLRNSQSQSVTRKFLLNPFLKNILSLSLYFISNNSALYHFLSFLPGVLQLMHSSPWWLQSLLFFSSSPPISGTKFFYNLPTCFMSSYFLENQSTNFLTVYPISKNGWTGIINVCINIYKLYMCTTNIYGLCYKHTF